jgi:hypothetical protein
MAIRYSKEDGIRFLLTRGSPADRIAAARDHDGLRDWLVPAFKELSNRVVPPSKRDGKLLGLDDLHRLWYIQKYKQEYRPCIERYIEYLVLENGELGSFPEDLPLVIQKNVSRRLFYYSAL